MHIIQDIFVSQCYFPSAVGTNYNKMGGLQQQKFILSLCWRLEVWNQGVSRVGSYLRFCRRIYSMLLSYLLMAASNLWCPLACKYFTPASASVFMWCSTVSLSLFSQDARHVGLRACPVQIWPHPNYLHLQWWYFQIKSHSEVLERTWTLGGTIQFSAVSFHLTLKKKFHTIQDPKIIDKSLLDIKSMISYFLISDGDLAVGIFLIRKYDLNRETCKIFQEGFRGLTYVHSFVSNLSIFSSIFSNSDFTADC